MSSISFQGQVSVAETITGPMQIFQLQITINNAQNLTYTYGFSIVDITTNDNSTNTTGLFELDSSCLPAPTNSSIICAGLNLTSYVTNSTFNYTLAPYYNVSVESILIPPSGYGLPSSSVTSTLIVNVEALNKQPVFSPKTDTIVVPEDTDYPLCVYNVADVTSDPNGDTDLTYTLVRISQTGQNSMWNVTGSKVCFQGGVGAGVGTCCGRLFTVEVSPYEIEIEVQDQYGSPLPFPTFTLTVKILSVGDPPVLNTPQVIDVLENVTSFSFLVNATQTNPHPNVTVPLAFGIQSVSNVFNNLTFTLTESTTLTAGIGTLSAASATLPLFDAVKTPTVAINVSMTDTLYTLYSGVTLNVIKVKTPPYATNLPSNVSISEEVSGFKLIYTVRAKDRDNDVIRFSFLNDNKLEQSIYSYFSIDFSAGIVSYVNPQFDWFNQSTYLLPVMVHSADMNATSVEYLQVNLEMVNRPPYFDFPTAGSNRPNTTFTVLDNVTGSEIVAFEATDREGDPFYFNITKMTPEWNHGIVVEWGSYFLKADAKYVPNGETLFKYYSVKVYTIVVEVVDELHLTAATSSVTLTVSIKHVNQQAQWGNLPSTIYLQDDFKNGQISIFSIQLVDPNNGDFETDIKLLGVSPENGDGKFSLDTYGKYFRVEPNPQFDYATEPTYTAIFAGSNGVIASITNSLVVKLINAKNLYNEKSTQVTVYVNEDNTGTKLLLWDLAQTWSGLSACILTSADSIANFEVSTEGKLSTTTSCKFNYDAKTEYIVPIKCSTSSSAANTFTFTVSVKPMSRPPLILNLPKQMWIEEGDTHRDIDLYQVLCADPRAAELFYQMRVLPVDGTGHFYANDTGLIRTAPFAFFDYLKGPVYRLGITCSNGEMTATATLTVYISTTPVELETTVPVTVVGTDLVTVPITYFTTKKTTTTAAGGSNVESSAGLSDGEIGAIVGSLAGAILIAGVSIYVGTKLRKKAVKSGLTRFVPWLNYFFNIILCVILER